MSEPVEKNTNEAVEENDPIVTPILKAIERLQLVLDTHTPRGAVSFTEGQLRTIEVIATVIELQSRTIANLVGASNE